MVGGGVIEGSGVWGGWDHPPLESELCSVGTVWSLPYLCTGRHTHTDTHAHGQTYIHMCTCIGDTRTHTQCNMHTQTHTDTPSHTHTYPRTPLHVSLHTHTGEHEDTCEHTGTYMHSIDTHKCSVQFSCSVVSDSLRPDESQHARPPCPAPTPGVHSDSRPSSQ